MTTSETDDSRDGGRSGPSRPSRGTTPSLEGGGGAASGDGRDAGGRATPGAVAETAAEGGRRLRALVRAALSPGVWLVVGVQLALQLALSGLSGDEPAATWLLALSGLLLGFAWLQAGAYRALAHGRERLSAAETLRPGLGRFASFLWLFVKLGLLVALLSNIAVFLFTFGAGLSPATTARALAGSLGLLLAVVGFVFVYWLPLVFVTDDFRLFATLRRALRTAWRRLPQSGFLAVLILLPPALFALLPAGTTPWLLVPLASLASLLGWAAYIYCAEWLRDATPIPSAPAEPELP